MKNLADISPAQLRRAADIREQVDKLAHELHVIFGLTEPEKTAPAVRQPRLTRKRGWSLAQRRKFNRTMAQRRTKVE